MEILLFKYHTSIVLILVVVEEELEHFSFLWMML